MNWEPAYALLLFSGTIITFLGALCIQKYRNRKKLFLSLVVILNIGMLFFFKYYEFAASIIENCLKIIHLHISLPHFTILLPVGISFYVLQSLSYTIDVYRKSITPVHNFFRYSLFVSFFPQLVAGPIERTGHLLPQFEKFHTIEAQRIKSGAYLMLWGYFLKLVLADRCAIYVDSVYDNLYHHNGGSILLAILLFPFQIYGDFAGYSLIAIGCAKIMGFNLITNFKRPFFSSSISDFWRRWHISLSLWLKDYVYIPLGGSRKGEKKTYRNLILTFLVSGIWHGADWTFVVWGLLNGLIVSIERLFGIVKKKSSGVSALLRWGLFFIIICILRIFIRASSLKDVGFMLKSIFVNFGKAQIQMSELVTCLLAITILMLKEISEEFNFKLKQPAVLKSTHSVVFKICGVVAFLCFIILFGVFDGDQFIYFQF